MLADSNHSAPLGTPSWLVWSSKNGCGLFLKEPWIPPLWGGGVKFANQHALWLVWGFAPNFLWDIIIHTTTNIKEGPILEAYHGKHSYHDCSIIHRLVH
jgi:hypothetical protein